MVASAGPGELIKSPEVDIVLNLTPPNVHSDISIMALAAGKHVYSEKPLDITFDGARHIIRAAHENGLAVGGAPDTFMGSSHTAARQMIHSGAIGQVMAGTAFMMTPGVEQWHPSPDFFYKAGGGPLFDMGPYYITMLVSLLGPVVRISGSSAAARSQRIIPSGPRQGQAITVEVPTHVSATLEFRDGIIVSLITSFDVAAHSLPYMEIYGTEGTLRLPDPNFFRGPITIRKPGKRRWNRIWQGLRAPATDCRGAGLADMAHSLRAGKVHLANGELALHVVEVMEGILASGRDGRHIATTSALDLDLAPANP